MFEVFKAIVNYNPCKRRGCTRMCRLVGEFRSLRGKHELTYGISTCTGCWRETFLRRVDIGLNCFMIQYSLMTHCLVRRRSTLTNIWLITFKPVRNSWCVRSGCERSKTQVCCRSLAEDCGVRISPRHGSVL
jgi:hypothetical protein